MGIYDGAATEWDQSQAQVSIPRGWKRSRKTMICSNPNCKYHGPAAEKSRGSRAAMWILMAFFLLPGLIYGMFFSGLQYCCPRCGTVVHLA